MMRKHKDIFLLVFVISHVGGVFVHVGQYVQVVPASIHTEIHLKDADTVVQHLRATFQILKNHNLGNSTDPHLKQMLTVWDRRIAKLEADVADLHGLHDLMIQEGENQRRHKRFAGLFFSVTSFLMSSRNSVDIQLIKGRINSFIEHNQCVLKTMLNHVQENAKAIHDLQKDLKITRLIEMFEDLLQVTERRFEHFQNVLFTAAGGFSHIKSPQRMNCVVRLTT